MLANANHTALAEGRDTDSKWPPPSLSLESCVRMDYATIKNLHEGCERHFHKQITSAQQHLGRAGNSAFLSVSCCGWFLFPEYFRGGSRIVSSVTSKP